MTFTAFLKTALSDLFCVSQSNKNRHGQRHGNKASRPNGSWKGSHQHKTMLPQKDQHHGNTSTNTTQKQTNNWYLPPNPPNPPPNSPRPRPIRLPQNPFPAPPPSPRPRPIRSGEVQANNRSQVESPNNIPHHSLSDASVSEATTVLRPSPLNINKPLPPVPLFQDPIMFPLPLLTVTAPSSSSHGQTRPPVQQLLTPEQQQETDFLTLLTHLEKALRHTHYAICGRAALYVWGYRLSSQSTTPPEKVSIVCPDGNEDIILSWAKAQGWTSVVSSLRGCSFGVPLGGSGGKTKVVNVKTARRMGLTLRDLGKEGGMPMAVKGTWAEAEKKVLKTQAAVVTLPALLGMLMEGFVTEVQLQAHHPPLHSHYCHEQQETEAKKSKKRVEEASQIILWVLSRLVERGERLSQDKVPEAFLTPFLAGWPESHALLEELGVSTFDPCFEHEVEQQSRLERESRLPLDAVTLAALGGMPPPPPPLPSPSPPPVLMKDPGRMERMRASMLLLQPAPGRTTSPAASCKSEDTIVLIQNEIEAWNCLSLEEASFAVAAETPMDETSGFETSSQVSEVSRAESNPWTSACSMSTAPSSVSVSSEQSGTVSRSVSQPSERIIRCVPPPWNKVWDERLKRDEEYPEWI